jgi:hypothetical protein
MKKIFAIAFAATSFIACNNSNTESTNTDTISTDTAVIAPVPTDTATAVTYVPADGDIIYRDSKVYVMKNGAWVETENDVTLDNGVVVYKTGKVRKADKEIELKEGEVVNKTGNFFDKSGHAIANAWDDTKDAVKDAGNAVGKAAKKVGKEIDTAVNGKDE